MPSVSGLTETVNYSHGVPMLDQSPGLVTPRVVVAGPWTPSSNGLFHRRVSSRLTELGADVTYLADRLPKSISEVESNIRIEQFPTRSCRTFRDLAWATRRIRYLQPHLVVARFGSVATILAASAFNRTPNRIAVVSSSPAAFRRDGFAAYIQQSSNRICGIAAHRLATEHWSYSPGHSNEIRDFFRLGTRPIEVHPMGIASVWEPTARETDVICIGRLSAAKGQGHLIRALAGTGYSLTLVGSGSAEAELRRMAHQFHVSVRFTGQLTPKQTFNELNRSKVSVLLTKAESFSFAVIESLSARTPVVSTWASGPASIIRNGQDGELVDRDNIAEVRAAICRVIGHRWQNYSDSAEERFREFYDLESAANQYASALLSKAEASLS